jgi:hypothetical protein
MGNIDKMSNPIDLNQDTFLGHDLTNLSSKVHDLVGSEMGILLLTESLDDDDILFDEGTVLSNIGTLGRDCSRSAE